MTVVPPPGKGRLQNSSEATEIAPSVDEEDATSVSLLLGGSEGPSADGAVAGGLEDEAGWSGCDRWKSEMRQRPR